MKTRNPPPLATWLLERSGAPEALIGDLAEAYLSRRSPAWYWREVLVASSLSLAKRIGSQKPRMIRLAATAAAAVWFFSYAVIGGQSIDLATAVQVDGLTTGWANAEAATGGYKLVPALSFTIKNTSSQPLGNVSVNAVFHRTSDPREWGNRFLGMLSTDGLGPGAVTATVVLASPVGYTSREAQTEMLTHSAFVDATVTLFGRHGSDGWTRLGEYPVARRLITP